MKKINRRIFLKFWLFFFAIVVSLPFLDISYIYAGESVGISGNAVDYRTKGYDAQQRGDIDTAIEWYQKAASIGLSYASPHNDLGILFEAKGWLDKAEAEYQKAIAINPRYKEVYANLALLCERKGELEKAAFYWMKRYKLGSPGDPWTAEAKARLEKLGLLDKTDEVSVPKLDEQQPAKESNKDGAAVKKSVQKKSQPKVKKDTRKTTEPDSKRYSEWKRLGAKAKAKEPSVKKSSNSRKRLDIELQESLRLAEERIKKEKRGKDSSATQPAARKYAESKPINDRSYGKAKDYYNKGEYAKALDAIRLAKQKSQDNKQLLELEEDIKFKMKEERIEDHYKEGIIHYRQKDFPGARREFESVLSILPE